MLVLISSKFSLIAPTIVLASVSSVSSLIFCLSFRAVCVAVEIGLSTSLVLSTLSNPTEALVSPVTEISFSALIAIFVPAV